MVIATSTPPGSMGVSTHGDGVQGQTTNSTYRGVYAENTGGGVAMAAVANSNDPTLHRYPSLYLMQSDAAGDFVVGAGSYWGTRYWRVDRTGKGYFNGGTQASGADFAEQLSAAGQPADFSPGDVLVISQQADRSVELAKRSFATDVIGVYSTKPGYLAGAPDNDAGQDGLPVAVVGVVPCKVSAENGAIRRGDLLVTAATPGHAMRAGADPPQGSVLGKALQPLASGTGVISILVTLQ